jgi:hypothetical protein
MYFRLVVGRHLDKTGIQDNKLELPCNVKFLPGKQVVPTEIYVNGTESFRAG